MKIYIKFYNKKDIKKIILFPLFLKFTIIMNIIFFADNKMKKPSNLNSVDPRTKAEKIIQQKFVLLNLNNLFQPLCVLEEPL